jgi:hypothetical protein
MTHPLHTGPRAGTCRPEPELQPGLRSALVPPVIEDGEGTDFQAVYHASRDEAECLSRARPDRSFHSTTDSAGGTRNHAR